MDLEEFLADCGKLATCRRCGALCKVADSRRLNARLMRHAAKPEGFCVNCALTHWLCRTEPMRRLLEHGGPGALRSPVVRMQVGRVLQAGGADAALSEVDWAAVEAHWALPLPEATR